MDTLILGLLILQDLTVYEIRAFLRQGMHLMYSDSMGSIQAAIKKLLKEKYIVFDEYVENGKNKKKYSITDDGKLFFLRWVSQPIQSTDAQNRILTKLYFMGMLPHEKRVLIIQSYIAVLEKKLDTLSTSFQMAKNIQLCNDLKDIAFFQLATMQLSIDSIQFEKDWYIAFIDRIKTQEDLA